MEESGGSRGGNEDEDAASDPTNGGDQGEPAAKDDDGGNAASEASAYGIDPGTNADVSTSCSRRSRPAKPSNPKTFPIEPSLMTDELPKELVDAGLI